MGINGQRAFVARLRGGLITDLVAAEAEGEQAVHVRRMRFENLQKRLRGVRVVAGVDVEIAQQFQALAMIRLDFERAAQRGLELLDVIETHGGHREFDECLRAVGAQAIGLREFAVREFHLAELEEDATQALAYIAVLR